MFCLRTCQQRVTINISCIHRYYKRSYLRSTTPNKCLHFTHLPKRSDNCFSSQVQKFHTSARKCIDPTVWPVIRNILKGAGVISGRGVRGWWNSLPDKKRQYFIHSVKRRPIRLLISLGLLGLGAYVYHHTHLQKTPVTGRKRFIAFTDYQFKKISEFNRDECLRKIQPNFVPPEDASDLYSVVLYAVNQIINANQDVKEIKETKWTVAIVNFPSVNAFVLPTGHIFINLGLLNFVQDPDQLAFVLAHEMSHAILKHYAEKLSQTQWIDYFVISALTVLWALMPTDGIAIVFHWFLNKVVNLLVHLPYSRFLEDEADKVGLELAAKACFDIRSGTVFWTRMSLAEKVKNDEKVEWLSTHPSSMKRAEMFDCLLHKYIHVRHECKCPPLPENDPRHVIHDLKLKVDNFVTSRKARANTQRFKIPPEINDKNHLAMFALADDTSKEFKVTASTLEDVKISSLANQDKTVEIENQSKSSENLKSINNVIITEQNESKSKEDRNTQKS